MRACRNACRSKIDVGFKSAYVNGGVDRTRYAALVCGGCAYIISGIDSGAVVAKRVRLRRAAIIAKRRKIGRARQITGRDVGVGIARRIAEQIVAEAAVFELESGSYNNGSWAKMVSAPRMELKCSFPTVSSSRA